MTPEIFFRSPTEAMDEIIIEGQMQNLGPWTVEGMGCTPVSIQLVKKQYLKLSVFSPPFPFLSPFPSRSL